MPKIILPKSKQDSRQKKRKMRRVPKDGKKVNGKKQVDILTCFLHNNLAPDCTAQSSDFARLLGALYFLLQFPYFFVHNLSTHNGGFYLGLLQAFYNGLRSNTCNYCFMGNFLENK